MDFDIGELNPVVAVLAVISGMLGIMLAKVMMPGNLLMMSVVFSACTFLGYVVCRRIAES